MRKSSANAALGTGGTGILAALGESSAPAAGVTQSELTTHATDNWLCALQKTFWQQAIPLAPG